MTLIKQAHQNNVCFVIIGTLKMVATNLNHMFVISVMMLAYKSRNIAILNVKGVDFRCTLWGIIKKDVANIQNNSVLEDKGVL